MDVFNNGRLPPIEIFGSWIDGWIFFFFFFYPLLSSRKVESRARRVSSTAFDRKIIVQWWSRIYPTYIRAPRDRSWNRSNVSRRSIKDSEEEEEERSVDRSHRSVTTVVRASQNLSTFYHIIPFSISLLFSRQKEENFNILF